MTGDELAKICAHAKRTLLDSYLPFLSAALVESDISTAIRQAAFVAQLAHESGEFHYMEELADGSAYEGRKDLGNLQPGDGKRYKGRGPIQLTGRNNYRLAGAALGLDLEGSPEQAAVPAVGFRTAAWFWKSRGLNVLADGLKVVDDRAKMFDAITRKINGGLLGKPQRDAYFALACKVLGC